MATREAHRALVVCKYGNAKFGKCVTSSDRAQLIHQVCVTGLEWGVFIMPNVESYEGSIVQIVSVQFSDAQKNFTPTHYSIWQQHLSVSFTIQMPLIGALPTMKTSQIGLMVLKRKPSTLVSRYGVSSSSVFKRRGN